MQHMLYVFQRVHNMAKATNNIFWAENKGVVDHSAVTR